jgi:Arc/MetJ-type ribon-helix-helix transcriptional regulator
VGQATKKKAVFTAEPEQLEQIEALVRSGRYRSASAFLREAIREKLTRLKRERLEQQVAQYCAEGHALEDDELIGLQALDEDGS